MEFKSFVIHLERRHDRLQHLRQQPLLPHTIYSAIDGTALPRAEYLRLFKWYFRGEQASRDEEVLADFAHSCGQRIQSFCQQVAEGQDLKKAMYQIQLVHLMGIIGCARSHYEIWRIVAEQACAGLIFEDDVVVQDATFELLKNSQIFPADKWDVIYLNLPNKFDLSLCSEGHSAWLRRVTFDDRRSFGTFAYLISPDGARAFIEHIDRCGVIEPIDWYMNYAQRDLGLNYFVLEPSLNLFAGHAELTSDVQPPRIGK